MVFFFFLSYHLYNKRWVPVSWISKIFDNWIKDLEFNIYLHQKLTCLGPIIKNYHQEQVKTLKKKKKPSSHNYVIRSCTKSSSSLIPRAWKIILGYIHHLYHSRSTCRERDGVSSLRVEPTSKQELDVALKMHFSNKPLRKAKDSYFQNIYIFPFQLARKEFAFIICFLYE